MQASKIESGVQLFSRVTRKIFLEGINPHFFPEGGPHPNQVVEITGDPHIEKNDLLIDFIVKCILPNAYNNEWKGSGAVLINTEFQINLFKIIKVIETHVKRCNILEPSKVIIETALKNLTILDCYDMEALEMTFYNLEKIIHKDESISLVAIDNITAQYWISKYTCHMLSFYQHSLNNFEAVYNVVKNLNILFIFVRHNKIGNKMKFGKNVDIRIEVENAEDENFTHNAIITNYEKDTTVIVPFRINTGLEF